MASMKLVGQMEEQPSVTKPRIDNAKEQEEIGSSNESNLPKSTEQKDEEPDENSTMDLLDCRHSRPLLLELNCEIFKCLDLLIQRKFICGLGRDIYGMFSRKNANNLWRTHDGLFRCSWLGRNRVGFVISEDGLNLSTKNALRPHIVYVEKGFPISQTYARLDNFPGTILYYYEVNVSFRYGVRIGLSSGTIPAREVIGGCPNSYAISQSFGFNIACYLAGERHNFQLPQGAIRPERKEYRNIYGTGLVLDPENKLAIFFTLNGKLLGKQIPISPSVAILFPTVRIREFYGEANFGDDPANLFEFDTKDFPGLGLACI